MTEQLIYENKMPTLNKNVLTNLSLYKKKLIISIVITSYQLLHF